MIDAQVEEGDSYEGEVDSDEEGKNNGFEDNDDEDFEDVGEDDFGMGDSFSKGDHIAEN